MRTFGRIAGPVGPAGAEATSTVVRVAVPDPEIDGSESPLSMRVVELDTAVLPPLGGRVRLEPLKPVPEYGSVLVARCRVEPVVSCDRSVLPSGLVEVLAWPVKTSRRMPAITFALP